MHIAVVLIVNSFSLLCLNPAAQGWPTDGPCMACGDAFVVSLVTTLSRVAFIHTEMDATDLYWVCGKVGYPWRTTA